MECDQARPGRCRRISPRCARGRTTARLDSVDRALLGCPCMGTTRRGKERASDPSWPDEVGTDSATLPSYWPEAKTEAVLAEAARPSWIDGPSGRSGPL